MATKIAGLIVSALLGVSIGENIIQYREAKIHREILDNVREQRDIAQRQLKACTGKAQP